MAVSLNMQITRLVYQSETGAHLACVPESKRLCQKLLARETMLFRSNSGSISCLQLQSLMTTLGRMKGISGVDCAETRETLFFGWLGVPCGIESAHRLFASHDTVNVFVIGSTVALSLLACTLTYPFT